MARAVATQAFTVFGLTKLSAEVDVANKASIAVVTRLGMTAYDLVPGALGPLQRYVLSRTAEQQPSDRP